MNTMCHPAISQFPNTVIVSGWYECHSLTYNDMKSEAKVMLSSVILSILFSNGRHNLTAMRSCAEAAVGKLRRGARSCGGIPI